MRKMKDSGIEWIGEIPEDWKIQRAKFLFRQRSEKGNKNPVLLSPTQKNGVVPQSELEGVVKLKEETDLQSLRTVHSGDYIISLRSFQGGFELSNLEGVCSPAYQVFFPIADNISHQFFKYLFKSETFIEKINNLTTGIREGKNILYADFANILLPVPYLSEQVAIANFLDEKCAVIDRLVERHQEVIEKLKAYRQSVISETVTRGLDPDAPMKDSGIPWIGKIPSHWNIAKLKYLANIYGGATPSKDFSDYWNNGNIPWISAKDLKTNKIYTSSDYITHEGFESCSLSLIEANSLIICTRSGILKHTLPAVINKIPVTINQDLKSLTFNKNIIHTQFIQYLFLGRNSQLLILLRNSGATVESIDIDLLKNIFICIPPLEEQQQISKYLDEICMAFDSIITKKQSLIAKLTEYKKSIIYEYVTGKKEVPAS